ncbi:putative transcription factor C2C2-GATA family [Helianthus annuus]|nr:putative transcription factor C2C2-GATA family [Helianthus annuus]
MCLFCCNPHIIMDLKDKRSVEEKAESPLASSNQTKCCTDCQTTTTPLWRGGPAGPKSLCNACGIKYNKKRRSQMSGYDKSRRKTSKNAKRNGDLLKVRVMVIDQKQQQQQQQRKRSSYERGKPWWNKLREEEQAAILLMAISCGGSLY